MANEAVLGIQVTRIFTVSFFDCFGERVFALRDRYKVNMIIHQRVFDNGRAMLVTGITQ